MFSSIRRIYLENQVTLNKNKKDFLNKNKKDSFSFPRRDHAQPKVQLNICLLNTS